MFAQEVAEILQELLGAAIILYLLLVRWLRQNRNVVDREVVVLVPQHGSGELLLAAWDELAGELHNKAFASIRDEAYVVCMSGRDSIDTPEPGPSSIIIPVWPCQKFQFFTINMPQLHKVIKLPGFQKCFFHGSIVITAVNSI